MKQYYEAVDANKELPEKSKNYDWSEPVFCDTEAKIKRIAHYSYRLAGWYDIDGIKINIKFWYRPIPELISEEEIDVIIEEVENRHPYKEAGNRDSYSPYNEGWSDACDILGERFKAMIKELKK